VDQEQPRWRTIGRWVIWSGSVLVALGFVLALAFSIYGGYGHGWKWTGIVTDTPYPKRTLWDWLQLLIIPVVLAGGGLWFNRQQRAQELQTADRRAQDESLQAYLDQMSNLLIPNNDQPSLYDECPPDGLRAVARARTLTVLSRLDGYRKGSVVQFLYEAGLIARSQLVLDLREADLSKAYLRIANLSETDLSHTNLSEADLRAADLRGADLSIANLSKAALYRADLRGTDLRGTDLKGANLSEAVLSEAALIKTDLSGANLTFANLNDSDLTDALLDGAKGITNEVLEQQAETLEGATMPNGQKYEEWLKDKKAKAKDERNE
jgi:uncharacterized protein YjbI with pentapeptide repeats